MPDERDLTVVDGYDEDLAYIHDAGHGSFAATAADGLMQLLHQAGIDSGRVLDLGCGSGLWARRLVDSGYDVFGLDLSPAMIQLARQRVPEARFQVTSFADAVLLACRAVTAIGEPFNYLFDPGWGMPQLIELFRRIFAALSSGGLLMFDVATIGLDRHRLPTFVSGEDWACLVRFDYQAERDRLTRNITTFRRLGDLYRRREMRHELQLYDPREVTRQLRAVGFRVRRLKAYGRQEMLPSRVAFAARKPGRRSGTAS